MGPFTSLCRRGKRLRHDPEYPCCTFRGSVVALRVRDGSQLWKTYMTERAEGTGRNKRGTPQLGPSGVGDLVDANGRMPSRGVLDVTTGDDYSSPATETSDAVIART